MESRRFAEIVRDKQGKEKIRESKKGGKNGISGEETDRFS